MAEGARLRLIRWIPLILLAAAAVLAYFVPGSREPERPPRDGENGRPAARYVGSAACRPCHGEIYEAWARSHHARAEEPLRPEAHGRAFRPDRDVVAGGIRWRLRERRGRFEVETTGSDGDVHVYYPSRAIGVEPLWQLVVAGGRGRYQATSLAYDPARDEWFDVFGDENRRPDEWGFWANRGMTWNSMCATCHVTDFRKNYDAETDSYRSEYVELGVGCEACHGPSSAHVAAESARRVSRGAGPAAPRVWPALGFRSRRERELELRKRGGAATADWDPILDTCGACHARRVELTGRFRPGERFLDHFRPIIPDETETYYADGQVRDENYEYVSFISSRMYREGVRCIHCHEPHSGRTWAEGNELCLVCHREKIDPAAHSHHDPAAPGGRCVDCHMPVTVYMQRDPRRDHGFTIPDPVLTRDYGIPNACNRCHSDQSVAWAIEAAEKWYGPRLERETRQRARVIARAQRGEEGAQAGLLRLLEDDPSVLWKAVAAGLLSGWIEEAQVRDALLEAFEAPEALVRAAAARALEPLAEAYRGRYGKLLEDPVRLVRVEAAWALRRRLDPDTGAARDLMRYLDASCDHPLGALQRGVYLLDRNPPDPEKALEWIRKARTWDPNSAPLYSWEAIAASTAGRPGEAVEALERAIRLAPGEVEYVYQLALALHEAGRTEEAVKRLEEVVKRDPQRARAWYNLALARQKLERIEKAREAFERALALEPDNPDYLYAYAAFLHETGETARAREILGRLEAAARGAGRRE